MARKKKAPILLPSVSITGIAAEGNAIGKVNEQVVFVPFAAPGDVATLQVTKKKSNFMQARIVELEQTSPLRVEPRCKHFGVCGGCKWQHIPYEMQLEAKDQQVRDALCRLGHLEVATFKEILGSEEIFHYRNKLEFTFSNKRWLLPEEKDTLGDLNDPKQRYGLGFHIPGMFDKVLDLDECYLGSPIADRIRLFTKNFCLNDPELYPFFDLRQQEGLMRTMLIRTTSDGQLMLIIVFFKEDEPARCRLLDAIVKEFPEISSLLYVINEKCNDTIADQELICYHGKDYIEETMEGLRFKIGGKSFFQTNSKQAYELYKLGREMAGLKGDELVYDLYTGTGTIANFVATSCRQVIGIEYVPEAIEDAKVNSRINGIENTLFYAGDMKDILNENFINEHGKPNLIITDPPRAGMHNDVIDAILFAQAEKIVYISCNPATQARDAALLCAGGYEAVLSQAVDMFPHTHHVENVLLLQRK